MSTIINGDSPSVTFSDGTTQSTAALPLTGGTVTGGVNLATSSGNVGIGTASPSTKLEILNTSSGSISTQLFVRNGATADGSGARIDFAALDSSVSTGSISNVRDSAGNYSVRFSTYGGGSNAERMRIDSGGKVFNNCTGQTGDAPNATGGRILETNGNQKIRGSSDGQAAFQFYSPSGGTGSPVGNIAMNASSVSYNTSSDYRLKEKIAPMSGALEKVSALKPVTYKWKSTGEESQGFIAHELAEVVPDCVTGEKDAVNEEGNPVYQGIDTSFLVATLTAAIQELKTELDATKAEVAALKAK